MSEKGIEGHFKIKNEKEGEREGSLGTRYYDEAPAASIEKPAVNIYSSFQLQQKSS